MSSCRHCSPSPAPLPFPSPRHFLPSLLPGSHIPGAASHAAVPRCRFLPTLLPGSPYRNSHLLPRCYLPWCCCGQQLVILPIWLHLALHILEALPHPNQSAGGPVMSDPASPLSSLRCRRHTRAW
ncbi:hypothetical protein C2845_PM09G06170 [Panicum miliaceum]|uniref:Uncharacterized protein n=1 Tax=Panicum miliaceum TaxID=4540 RepID=A0A3L6RWM5_PANMI|nr:hypothetical protein C2845_PM09G06170 [Panicum miliaceum]